MKHTKWILSLMIIGAVCLGISPSAAIAQKAEPLPLSVAGPNNVVGMQAFTFVDETRDKSVTGFIWYPAGQKPPTPAPIVPRKDLAPDTSVAPYPLVIYSHGRSQDGVSATTTLGAAPQLASYGFAVLSIENNDPPLRQIDLIQRPMDILFVLNHLAAIKEQDALAGLIDFDHVGMTGYSLGAWTALLFSGARLDPSSRDTYCATVEKPEDLACAIGADVLQQMLDERAQYDPPLIEGEPWPAYTDDRIIAVMPVAPCFGPFFGERGLAAATLPTLIIGLERDERCTYERDALYIYDYLGSEDRALLTVFKQGHADAVLNRAPQKIFNHFAVAFFGYYLQGKTDYAQYLTADFVNGIDNLEWTSSTD